MIEQTFQVVPSLISTVIYAEISYPIDKYVEVVKINVNVPSLTTRETNVQLLMPLIVQAIVSRH